MSLPGFSLEGKVALVTGGSRGIGRSIVMALAEAGADVAIAARKPEPLEEAAEAVRAIGREALAVSANVRETEELSGLVSQVRAELGRVDILVNNAGANPVQGPIQDVEEWAWDLVMRTNVRAPFFLSRLAREAMVEQGDGGSIINVGSSAGVRPYPGLGAYSVSKAALVMLTKVCAMEWGRDGIRVNCIVPGLIQTEFSRALWDDEETVGRTIDQSALGRIGAADEVAGAAVYLASPSASFVTGETLVLDGGETV